MEFRYTPQQEAWRQEVRDFLDAELPPDKAFNVEFDEDDDLWAFAFEFTRKVGARGWIGLTWPVEYGGLGRSPVDRTILAEEFGYREAPLVGAIGWGLAAGSLLVGGTEEQKKRFLPSIARLDQFWVEGLSEPGAGSDLASLTTTARRDGDDWIINGQKTYTTWGQRGEVMYLAARTDPDSKRHRGISVFCMDMKAKGVTMSPLENLGGGRQNHTYLDNVRVPGDMLLGHEGQGWYYIMNSFYGGGGGGFHTVYQRMLDEVSEYCRTTERAGRPMIEDPMVRQDLGELALMVENLKLLGYEGVSNSVHKRAPQFGGALAVVYMKEMKPRFSHVMQRIMGPVSQLRDSPWTPLGGNVEAWYRHSYANHAGGTSQVKRMVLATRGLGLPR